MKILIGILSGIAGFVVGWLVCAFMTAGKTEDAYAEGYDQACKDLQTNRTCPKCSHLQNCHTYQGCQIVGCNCPNNFLHTKEPLTRK